jgi:hypothetical protein
MQTISMPYSIRSTSATQCKAITARSSSLGPLSLDYQPFRRDTDLIDTSSVAIGRLGDTLSFMTKRTLWQYGRKVKHLLLEPPRRKAEY